MKLDTIDRICLFLMFIISLAFSMKDLFMGSLTMGKILARIFTVIGFCGLILAINNMKERRNKK